MTEKVLAAVYKALSDHHVYLEVRLVIAVEEFCIIQDRIHLDFLK